MKLKQPAWRALSLWTLRTPSVGTAAGFSPEPTSVFNAAQAVLSLDKPMIYRKAHSIIGLKVASFQMKFVHIIRNSRCTKKFFSTVSGMSKFLLKVQPPVRVTSRSMMQAEAWKRTRWRPVISCDLDVMCLKLAHVIVSNSHSFQFRASF